MIRIPHHRDSSVRRLGLGVLAYKCFYRPLEKWHRLRTRGLASTAAMAWGEQRMRRAGVRLPSAATAPVDDGACATFLTGHAYWWQTIWCAWTLACHTGGRTPLEIVDDGSLRPAELTHLRRLLPEARFVTTLEIEAQLRDRLPPEEFPLIWFYRRVKPIFRKFTDIFGRDDQWRLLLDSDMLFFRPPECLEQWLREPDRPCYMIDVHNAYGYSPELMRRLAGAPIPDLVNIGIFGFTGRLVDWPRVERWLKELIETEGLKYNLTQAISAMHLAARPCLVLPAADYQLLPTRQQVEQPAAVLQHYVAESKEWYLRTGWRVAAERAGLRASG